VGATNASVGSALSDRFPAISGIRQRCVLVPALFTRFKDWIIDTMKSCKGLTVGGSAFTDLDYTDDIVLPVTIDDELGPCLAYFSLAAQIMSLNVSWPDKDPTSLTP